jgi:regulator of replication initiation timing
MAALIEQNETLTTELSRLRKEVAQLRDQSATTTQPSKQP